MGKHLLLLLLLLLGLSVLLGCVQALKCFQCPRFNAAGTCESLEGVCETRGSQQCFLKKVYEGGSLQHGSQGCEDLCVPMSFSRPNIEVDFMCCGDQSFCNKFEA
ncbi:protein PIP-1 [Oryctolagus cuniculus]|uniref:UPAR/Ly6 domain-containing protein n=1 Tax=Oryctolagus cuniculus TaxID=9986 RepID=G1TK70_RABIT|nr:protein PIP-1 [Oryctolagus cuniculus]